MPHSLILLKLERLGVRDIELQWFRDYLTGRKQSVVLNGSVSPQRTLLVGVPQGSLLGVLLFQILINDLPKCLKHCSSILYADDTTIFVSGRSLKFLRVKLQSDLNYLSSWLCVNGLKLNVDKTKVLLFNREGLNPMVHLFFENMELETMSSFKFLGLWIDSKLSFDIHFRALHRKLSSFTFIASCLRTLYFAYFHSCVSYGIILWLPLINEKERNTLMKLQKCIVQNICRVTLQTHCMPLFKKERILLLNDILYVENCKMMFTVDRASCPKLISNLFEHKQLRYETRGGRANVPPHRSSQFNRSFLCKSVTDWGNLSVEIRSLDHIKLLARQLRMSILNKY